jgi:diguanylate cyclase (GGDEF)-like protein
MIRMLLGGLVSLDLATLVLASGFVVTICGVIFVLSTVLQHNDVPSRLWSTAFILGILTMVSFAVWAAVPDAMLAIGVGNGSLVMSMGFIWSGSRAFNDRKPLHLVSLAGGGTVALISWLNSAVGSWAGGQIFLLGVAVFALLAAVEALRGRMGRSLNARILAVVMFVVGVFYSVRAVVFATNGPDSAVFRDYLDSDITTFVTILFVVTASTSMAVLRTEGSSPRSSRTRDEGRWEKFASTDLFTMAVNDRLERLERTSESSVLVRVEIDNLSEMNTAFGRSFSDAAMTLVGSVLRDTVSASAVMGHAGNAGFDAVMFESLDQALDCAQRVRSVLVDTPIDASQGLRVSVTIALVVPEPGERFAALSERASQLVAEGHAAGGNVILGHPEEYSRA